MKHVRAWASIKRALSGVQEEALDKESGTQDVGPALPSNSCVTLKKSLHFLGFQWAWVMAHRILKGLPLLIASQRS